MNKHIVFAVFLSISGSLGAFDGQDVIVTQEKPSETKIEQMTETDTTIHVSVKSYDTIINGDHLSTDSILVEKVIERTEPLLVMYEKKEWGKLIIGIMSLFFVIASILWNRKKKKQSKPENHE